MYEIYQNHIQFQLVKSNLTTSSVRKITSVLKFTPTQNWQTFCSLVNCPKFSKVIQNFTWRNKSLSGVFY